MCRQLGGRRERRVFRKLRAACQGWVRRYQERLGREASEAGLRGAGFIPWGMGATEECEGGSPPASHAYMAPVGPQSTAVLLRGRGAAKGPAGCEAGPASLHTYLGAALGPRLGHPSRRWQPAVWMRGAAAGPDTRSGRRLQYQGLRAAVEQAQGDRVLA